MIHDLFSLKVKLNARHLTTEMGSRTFTLRWKPSFCTWWAGWSGPRRRRLGGDNRFNRWFAHRIRWEATQYGG